MKHRIRLVTANDPSLFEERLERILAEIPDDATIVEVGFDTTADGGGTMHFSALVRIQITEPWR